MAYMEVLLREDVDHLGHRGQVVRVRSGYGRNYLLPQGLAIEATPGNKRQITEQRRVLEKRETRERATAEGQADKLNGLELVFERRAGEHGILYGSVTSMDIAAALKEHGYEIERRRISLREAIKEIGEYDVAVKLHREVNPTVRVLVRKEGAPASAAAAPAAEGGEQAEVEAAAASGAAEEPVEAAEEASDTTQSDEEEQEQEKE
jgi:large subunit ribosomal protein L9